ncbi:MAG: methyltransferase domain-containing protein [Candidatus Obscuribacterales bacterium]|nr:methyltransferase domain-containing protein [Candidatus Obscuribacterales bacterium]
MKESLLSFIRCIFCRHELSLADISAASGSEILEAKLACNNCQAQFPVHNGVPRLVSTQVSVKEDLNTGAKFAVSWNKFSRLDARYFKQFFDWIAPVKPEDLKDKVVLEAGCGKGRHTQIVAECGAQEVVAVDIGDVVDLAYANVGHLPNVHIVQSDINVLPLARVFDFAFSVGVLHHMLNPRCGFESMTKLVKAGGSVCVWLYGRENNGWIVNVISPLRNAFTSKIPGPALTPIAWLFTVPLYAVAKGLMVPYARMQKKAKWLPELFYQEYLAYIGKFDFNEIESIVYDHLIAPVAYYIPRSEVESWFNQKRFTNKVIRWHNKNSWTACAKIEDVPSDSTATAKPEMLFFANK